MQVQRVDELEAFAARAWPLLVEDEANHTIILAVIQGARRARDSGEPDPGTTPWRSALVSDGGTIVAAACRSRGNWLVSTGPPPAFSAIGAALHGDSDYRGIVGPEPSAQALAESCGAPMVVHTTLPLMKLQSAPDGGATPAPGRLVVMTSDISEAHWNVVLAWALAFRDEARLTDPKEHVERDLRARLSGATLFLWLDAGDMPACLIGAGPIAPSGARIGPVYTPPALRGRGYARAAVTAACVNLLARGTRSVFLFTDAANPTSNLLYRKIGFVPIGQHVHLSAEGG